MTISIITATYNSAKTLEKTLGSVLSQTYKDIDYWIIDGGSKDKTLDIVKKYEPLFGGRMHWVSEPDKGIYDAMNKGLKLATGDVVGLLNSDDYYTSNNVLAKIVDSIEGYDAVYGDVHFVNDKNMDNVVRYYSSKSFRPWLLRFGLMPAHPSFYARREVYEKSGYYALDYKIASDYDMMVRLFMKTKIKAKYIPMDFVTMRLGGVSTNNWKNRLVITKEDIKACRRHGIYTNGFMISMKYFKKIFELRTLKRF